MASRYDVEQLPEDEGGAWVVVDLKADTPLDRILTHQATRELAVAAAAEYARADALAGQISTS